MTFSEKLKQLRSEKGVSQNKLAADIHISRSAVAKWENGLGMPNDDSMQLLAAYFGVTVEELKQQFITPQYQETTAHIGAIPPEVIYEQINTAHTKEIEDNAKHAKTSVKVTVAMVAAVLFLILMVILSVLFPKVLILFLELIAAGMLMFAIFCSTFLTVAITVAALIILILQFVMLLMTHRGHRTGWLMVVPLLSFAVVVGYHAWVFFVLRNSFTIFAGGSVTLSYMMWVLVYAAIALMGTVKSPGKRIWNLRTVFCIAGIVLNIGAVMAIFSVVDWFQGELIAFMLIFNGICSWVQVLLTSIVCFGPGMIKRRLNKKRKI